MKFPLSRFLPFLLFALIFALPVLACGGDEDFRNPNLQNPTSTPQNSTIVFLVFSPDTLPEAQVGQPYTVTVTISKNRTPAFRLGADEKTLPAGLTGVFDKSKQTYTLSGSPTQPGTYKIRVEASCYGTNVPGQTGRKEYELVVK